MPNLAKKQTTASCHNRNSPCKKQPNSRFTHFSRFLPSIIVWPRKRFDHNSIGFSLILS